MPLSFNMERISLTSFETNTHTYTHEHTIRVKNSSKDSSNLFKATVLPLQTIATGHAVL